MKKIKMSVLGIGPVYVLSCLIVTVLSIYLSEKGSNIMATGCIFTKNGKGNKR